MGVSRSAPAVQQESGGRCEYAGIGDTHNDLRFAVSQLSGDVLCCLAYWPGSVSTSKLKGNPCLTWIRRIIPSRTLCRRSNSRCTCFFRT